MNPLDQGYKRIDFKVMDDESFLAEELLIQRVPYYGTKVMDDYFYAKCSDIRVINDISFPGSIELMIFRKISVDQGDFESILQKTPTLRYEETLNLDTANSYKDHAMLRASYTIKDIKINHDIPDSYFWTDVPEGYFFPDKRVRFREMKRLGPKLSESDIQKFSGLGPREITR